MTNPITTEDLAGLSVETIVRWAADCADHVLPLWEAWAPDDTRPSDAIAAARTGDRAAAEAAWAAARAAAAGATRAAAWAAWAAAWAAAWTAWTAWAANAADAADAAEAAADAAEAAVEAAEAAGAAGADEIAWQREQLRKEIM